MLDKPTHLAVQLIYVGESAAVQVPLSGLAELLIGRKQNCTLQLKNSRVSGGHAKVYQQAGEWHLCDINSSNGTYVNGTRTKEQILREGDVILIGAYELVFSSGSLLVYGEAETIALHPPEDEGRTEPSPAQKKAPAYPFFTRSPRLSREKPSGRVEIEAAPNIGSKPEVNWLTVLLPPIGTLILTFLVTFMMAMSPISMAFTAPMMLMGIVVALLNYRNQTKKYNKKEALLREKYQQYIQSCDAQLMETVRQQRDAALYPFPAPRQCLDMACQADRRLWECTANDKDFLTLRLGIGEEPLSIEVQTPKVGFILEESAFTYTPQQLVEKYRTVNGVPVCCDLLRMPTLGIIGERSQTISAAHAVAVQAATRHGYDEVKLVVLFPKKERERWDWMRWLPHTWSISRDTRYLACTKYDANQLLTPLEEELKRRLAAGSSAWDHPAPPLPHYLFLVSDLSLLWDHPVADYLMRNDPTLGVSCILLTQDLSTLPSHVTQILDARAKDSELYHRERTNEKQRFQPDLLPLDSCDAFARALAPIRLPEKNSAQLLPSTVTFLQGYRVQRPEQLDIEEFWADSCNYKSMSVPIGVRTNGEAFYFDIHEKKHGPHGLVAGMTGSGKTEMVQSWILSMALQFSPQDVSFVLIDFKGTGLIQPFLDLPHLAGTISDLDTSIGRNLIALRNEVQRRKALFDSVSSNGPKVTEIGKYIELYRAGKVSEPLPYLFVIIDEYAEFKVKFPDFTSEVNTLFHVGRSLGIYIILMTQNPSGVVSSESEHNVKFRWCLKVADPGGSKEALGGHDDAAYLTNPGRAYVRVGSDEVFELVQSFYSGADYQPNSAEEQNTRREVSLVGLDGSRIRVEQSAAKEKHGSQISQIEAVVRYIRAYTTRRGISDARPIWRDRMPGRFYLPQLLEQAVPHKPGELCPVVGMLDDPAAQVQRPLYLPLSSDGHAAIYGSPGSGKTVFLQTLAASLCMEYSPEEVTLYMMDFGSWSMGMFRNFPHVVGVANDNEEEKILAISKTLKSELQQRKERFSKEGVGNLRTYLQVTGERLPYLVLLVDKFESVYHQYPQLEDFFIQLGQAGGNYGIYLAVTAGNPFALGNKLRQCIKTSVALAQTDTADYSSIVGKTGGLLPEPLPGRGLFLEDRVLEFQTALPAAESEEGTYVMAIRALGEELTDRWGANQAASLAVMPSVIPFGSVQAQNSGFVLGLDTENVQPVEADLDHFHHLLISGLPQSGKTTLLCTLARQMKERDNVRVVLFADSAEYTCCGDGLEFLADGGEMDQFLENLAGLLNERQKQKKSQPDLTFLHVYLVIDNYKACFDAISQQSVSRLRALVQIGAGLGVSLVAACDAASLSTLAQYGETVTMLLTKGPAILLGGKPLEHMAVDPPLETTSKNQSLKQWEGWYWTAQGIQRFKAMDAAEAKEETHDT